LMSAVSPEVVIDFISTGRCAYPQKQDQGLR
jgi:hypothetical protein